ncbi:hypothetical protein JCM21900_001722 [Sporobolomyces salmonicolor]
MQGGQGQPGDVHEITVLKSQPRSEEALQLLRKIHSLVKPIMKRYGWTLPVLAEFFPRNPNLLGININRGAKICIRLRSALDPHSFLPLEESLIGTMLHELTHNVRGPHDDIFFKHLDRLWQEYDALRTTGYEGEGFLGRGTRVGQGVGHDTDISLQQAREKALKTFEEKERVRKILGKGGKLGGKALDSKGKRMGDILAEAAERRLKVKKGCGGDDSHNHPSGSKKEDLPPEVQAEIDRADADSRHIVLDLTAASSEDEDAASDGDVEVTFPKASSSRTKIEEQEPKKRPFTHDSSGPELEILSSRRAASFRSSNPSSSASTANPPPSKRASRRRSRPPRRPKPAWTCPLCTFANLSALSLACEMCFSERSPETVVRGVAGLRARTGGGYSNGPDDGWACHTCARVNSHTFWTCTGCGTMKLSSAKG